ncbi:MAG: thioredoxin-like domain-containing protein [Prevotella sp.]|nr:thioredoxin-like domain-containing protein [Prevotella sp.]
MTRKVITFVIALAVTTLCWANTKNIIWDNPAIEASNCFGDGYFRASVDVTQVEMNTEETVLHLLVSSRPENGFGFAKCLHLRTSEGDFPATSIEGMEFDAETHTDATCRKDVKMHFKPLPRGTKKFDFIEANDNRGFCILGIQSAQTRQLQMFPSYWRNEETGDWELALLDDCAIYDCKFWRYAQRPTKVKAGDGAELTLTDGTKTVSVKVGKAKKGKRTITINGRGSTYSMITTRFLPDYPTKDTRTQFVDTHYAKADSVTFIGWMKDWPKEAMAVSNSFDIIYNDCLTDKQVTVPAQMDSLGRFSVTFPLLNSTEIFCDWKRAFVRNMVEPGNTYFLIYDYEKGQRMFMGTDARLQNEIMKLPNQWYPASPYEEGPRGKLDAMAFMNKVDSTNHALNAELEKRIKEHPNLSHRYVSFLKNNYLGNAGCALMQARYYIQSGELPQEYLDYIKSEVFDKLISPYTLCRENGSFLNDYTRYLVEQNPKASRSNAQKAFMELYNEGKIKASNKEIKAVETWAKDIEELEQTLKTETDQDKRQKMIDKFNNSEVVKMLNDMFERDGIGKLIEQTIKTNNLIGNVSTIRGLGFNSEFSDLQILRNLLAEYEYQHSPLDEKIMNFALDNISLPYAKDMIRQTQAKYVAIQNGDIAYLKSLKSSEGMDKMSDGEKIFRKAIEPLCGKFVIVDVWGTWCGPCREALSHSKEEYERLAKYDVAYLYFANNSPEDSWKNIIKEYGISGENVVHYNLPAAQENEVERYLKVPHYPSYRLVDKDGDLLDVNIDVRDLDATEKLLQNLSTEKAHADGQQNGRASQPAEVTISSKLLPDGNYLLQIDGVVAEGWYIYGPTAKDEGASPAGVVMFTEDATLIGELKEREKKDKHFDSFSFSQIVKAPKGANGKFIYSACNNDTCTPPQEVVFTLE